MFMNAYENLWISESDLGYNLKKILVEHFNNLIARWRYLENKMSNNYAPHS